MNDFYARVYLRRYDSGRTPEFGERIKVVVRIPEQVATCWWKKAPSILVDTVRQRVRSTAIKTVGAPIPPLAVGVISEVDATMSPELLETSNFQDDDETEGWIALVAACRRLLLCLYDFG